MRSLSPLAIAILVLLAPALAKSDWQEEDVSPMSSQDSSWKDRTNSYHLTPQLDPYSSDNTQPTMHAGTHQPLTGQVREWGGSLFHLNPAPYQSLNSVPWQEAILKHAAFLPPPKAVSLTRAVLRAWLQNTNQWFFEQLSTIPKDKIIEVKGAWDDSGHILRGLGIPYTRIGADLLNRTALAKVKVLIINCGANLNTDAQRQVNKFVSEGGFLLTTDWALNACLSPCFPGYVVANGGYTTAQVVDAVIVGKDESLLKGTVSNAFWQLEDRSQLVQVLNPAVNVLVRSRALMRQDPSRMGVLSVSFAYGQGKVLHLVGHFDNNPDHTFANRLPDPAPQMMISLRQAIATNFIASAFANDLTAKHE